MNRFKKHYIAARPLLAQAAMTGLALASKSIYARAEGAAYTKVGEILNKGTYSYVLPEGRDFYKTLLEWCSNSPDVRLGTKSGAKTIKDHINKSKKIHSVYSEEEEKYTYFTTEVTNSGSNITFWYKGVLVDVGPEEVAPPTQHQGENGYSIYKPPALAIKIEAKKYYLLDEIIEQIIAHEDVVRQPTVMISTQWGGWDSMPTKDMRSMESVVLPRLTKEDLIQDIQCFFDSRQDYAHLGLPWRRGYLFEGPPGGGKTSLLQAIAGHFGIDLYIMSLANFENDSKLHSAVSAIRPRSLLVFEDIDTFSSSNRENHSGEMSGTGITTSGLLNVIDGLMAPNGAIIVLTTNHPEKLDDALVRSGRIDYRIHFGPIGQQELDDFLNLYYPGENFDITLGRTDVMAVEIVNVLKRRPDPQQAMLELKAVVE